MARASGTSTFFLLSTLPIIQILWFLVQKYDIFVCITLCVHLCDKSKSLPQRINIVPAVLDFIYYMNPIVRGEINEKPHHDDKNEKKNEKLTKNGSQVTIERL